MNIQRELLTSDSLEATVGLSTPSAIDKAIDWSESAIALAADACLSQREAREEFNPRFKKWSEELGLHNKGWQDRFVYSPKFPGSKIAVVVSESSAEEHESTQPFSETDGYDSISIEHAIDQLLSA